MKEWFRGLDWVLLTQVFSLSIIGLFIIYSSIYMTSHPSDLYMRQFFWLFVSIICMAVCFKIDYHLWVEAATYIYWTSIFFLLVVLAIGNSANGARRWIRIGPISFQPTELAKFALVLMLVKFLSNKKNILTDIKNYFWILLIVALPLFLIIKQPDLGSALLLIPSMIILIYTGGVPIRRLIWTFLSLLVASPIIWTFLKEYQKKRIEFFLNPQSDPLGSGYNIIQSIIAIGSGGITGKGFLKETQNRLSFIPEHHTDFIFSVIGQEWGFIGTTITIVLYFYIFRQAILIANRARDNEGSLLALGFGCMITIQVLVNLGMTVGLLPVTGLTLPFISYGGSSLVFSSLAIGILLNISYANRRSAIISLK
jgi:rod shape determining protein RodA